MVLDGTGSVNGDTSWYLVVLGQYNLVVLGTWWYRVSIGLTMPVVVKVDIWWGATDPSLTHRLTDKKI